MRRESESESESGGLRNKIIIAAFYGHDVSAKSRSRAASGAPRGSRTARARRGSRSSLPCGGGVFETETETDETFDTSDTSDSERPNSANDQTGGLYVVPLKIEGRVCNLRVYTKAGWG